MNRIEKLVLRAKQMSYLLTSPHFASAKNLEESIYNSYSSSEDLSFYEEVAHTGLAPYEKPVYEYLKQDKQISQKRILVLGCGSGREVFALEKLCQQVYGMDIVHQMIDLASEQADKIDSTAKFFADSFPRLNSIDDKTVDYIFISSYLLNFLQGRECRIHYLKKLTNLLSDGGEIFVHPSVCRLKGLSLERISSTLLKVNSWFRRWKHEKGDHVISTYRGKGELMYFHHYPCSEEFLSEVRAAGYSSHAISEDFFSLRLHQ